MLCTANTGKHLLRSARGSTCPLQHLSSSTAREYSTWSSTAPEYRRLPGAPKPKTFKTYTFTLNLDAQVGVDAFLVPLNTAKMLKKNLEAKGHVLVALDANPVDPIWTERCDAKKDVCTFKM